MAKGYDSASMTVLQKELNMSRGAMYRYFDSKEDLFRAVIDNFFWVMLEHLHPDSKSEKPTTLEKIEFTYQNLKAVCEYIDKIDGIEIKFLNFTALIVQAAKRYPGFVDRLKNYKKEKIKDWERVLKNSIKTGEIRSDIDIKITAQIFARSISLNDEHPSKSFAKSAEEVKKAMYFIYSLIKA